MEELITQPIHVLVTGSSRGIGAAALEALTARGARVVCHERSDGPDQQAADLSDPRAADSLWERALERLDGRIDVLINNAGMLEPAPITVEAGSWRTVWARGLQINLQASADLCRQAVLHWRAEMRAGRIVNVASHVAYRGDSPDQWHYAAAKAGMVGMTKTIPRAYAAEQILSFAVCPWIVATDMALEVVTSATRHR
ncbi:SDR family NAD(P)-dependent oxidoreductase [Paraburkholderia youngii]|uniref:SDR family NAD(P)-dependent oxidoreductase n=1 Tax=Paraburkholderia youngii TaxID=2782701 RepID=UPI003D2093C0